MSISKKYIPDYLSSEDKIKARENILKSRENYKKGLFVNRVKIDSAKNKKSSYVTKFKDKYGDLSKDEIITLLEKKGAINIREGINKILSKGRGAFYSSGSRPNQTAFSWANARLYSVLMGSDARLIDKNIVDTYKIPLL